jgi:hypothetical protein
MGNVLSSRSYRDLAVIVGLAIAAFCVGVASAVLLEGPLLERVLGEQVPVDLFPVAEGLPEFLSGLVFLPAVRLVGPMGRRLGAFAGSTVLSAISLEVYDRMVASRGCLLAVALPLHPYVTIQLAVWTAGALIGAVLEGLVLSLAKRR